MEDMHIHLKEAIYNQELFNKYLIKCIDTGIEKAVFLDHGNRISLKHKPVLFTKYAVEQLNERLEEFKKSEFSTKIKILKGIEIDYSNNLEFRKETFNILEYGNFEWIVGAIHSMKFDNYGQYLETILDMLNNYNINVIAHIKKSEEYKKYSNIFNKILSMCNEKNVLIEINTSDRSRWSDEQLYFMLNLMYKHNVNFVYSSDAHKCEDIGYMIKETKDKVEKWNVERSLQKTR